MIHIRRGLTRVECGLALAELPEYDRATYDPFSGNCQLCWHAYRLTCGHCQGPLAVGLRYIGEPGDAGFRADPAFGSSLLQGENLTLICGGCGREVTRRQGLEEIVLVLP